jgi:hypothetical protein
MYIRLIILSNIADKYFLIYKRGGIRKIGEKENWISKA